MLIQCHGLQKKHDGPSAIKINSTIHSTPCLVISYIFVLGIMIIKKAMNLILKVEIVLKVKLFTLKNGLMTWTTREKELWLLEVEQQLLH